MKYTENNKEKLENELNADNRLSSDSKTDGIEKAESDITAGTGGTAPSENAAENDKTAFSDGIYSTFSEEEDKDFYLKRQTEGKKSFKERWAEMDSAQKKQHFKDYMMVPLIIGVIVLALLIRYGIKFYKEFGFVRYMISATYSEYVDEDKLKAHAQELHDKWKLGKRELIDVRVPIGKSSGEGNYTTKTSTLFDNFLYAGKVDVIIGVRSELEEFAYVYEDFNRYMPEDLLKKIPEEAFVTLQALSGDPDDYSGKKFDYLCAFKVKYTVLADIIKTDYITDDDLILVLPISDHNTGKDFKDQDFVRFLFGLD